MKLEYKQRYEFVTFLMYIKKLPPIDEGLREPDYWLDANKYKCNSGSDFSGGSCCIAIFPVTN